MATATKNKLNRLINLTLDQIANGRVDDRLDEIVDECQERRRVIHHQLAVTNMRNLSEIGTLVRIARNVKPKYLLGLTGKVVDRPEGWLSSRPTNPSTIYVDIGRIVRRKYGPIIGCPAACLEAADAS